MNTSRSPVSFCVWAGVQISSSRGVLGTGGFRSKGDGERGSKEVREIEGVADEAEFSWSGLMLIAGFSCSGQPVVVSPGWVAEHLQEIVGSSAPLIVAGKACF